ncbi:hypothetical protein GS597_19025 [Synechococcales cyanobacterium C]|uniref:Uncharacterized protein n=1 Tax=Petrachloros mirabilis ULC683 TaxID=2781853 RepID=A0A8K2A2B5_9CYAN|nr:hypothetical protein [Petrachloros mirabilis]NCJ08563.1 hypothetical protein [Petrachloros mirabilis ULC683]
MNYARALVKTATVGFTALLLDLSLAAFVPTVPAAHAQPGSMLGATTNLKAASSRVITSVSPFQLVHLAHQGHLESEGIPSANSLIYGYIQGKITPRALAMAAVNDRRLPASTLADKTYLRDVKNHLDDLTRIGNGN